MQLPNDILARAMELGLITLAWLTLVFLGRLLDIV
jgi:hypothetical protein